MPAAAATPKPVIILLTISNYCDNNCQYCICRNLQLPVITGALTIVITLSHIISCGININTINKKFHVIYYKDKCCRLSIPFGDTCISKGSCCFEITV